MQDDKELPARFLWVLFLSLLFLLRCVLQKGMRISWDAQVASCIYSDACGLQKWWQGQRPSTQLRPRPRPRPRPSPFPLPPLPLLRDAAWASETSELSTPIYLYLPTAPQLTPKTSRNSLKNRRNQRKPQIYAKIILVNRVRDSSILSFSFPTFFTTTASAFSLLPEALLRFLQPLRGLVEVCLRLQELRQLLRHDDGVALPQLGLRGVRGEQSHFGSFLKDL